MGLRVLVVEDSLVFQKIVGTVLLDTGLVEDVVLAATGREALQKAAAMGPDVVFLDLHLPDMDGLQTLAELKRGGRCPRVVVVSGMGEEGADLTIQALSRGALQFIRKPSGAGFQQSVTELRSELEPVLRTVAQQVGARGGKPAAAGAAAPSRPRTPAPAHPGPVRRCDVPRSGFWVTAVAVSTGGPQALSRVIPLLPADYPHPIVLVQHMPPLFTDSLAKSLDGKSALHVVEARAGMVLEKGTVYIAPGGRHLVIRKVDGRPVTALNDDPPEQSVKPAADVLFRSLAHFGSNQAVLAVVMTGMGEDGLAGVRALKLAGCRCLTQSEDSCVVYGMPRAVDLAGLSDQQVSLEDLAGQMDRLARGTGSGVGAR